MSRERQRSTFFEHFPGYAVALEFCNALEAATRLHRERRRTAQVRLTDDVAERREVRPTPPAPPCRRVQAPAAVQCDMFAGTAKEAAHG